MNKINNNNKVISYSIIFYFLMILIFYIGSFLVNFVGNDLATDSMSENKNAIILIAIGGTLISFGLIRAIPELINSFQRRIYKLVDKLEIPTDAKKEFQGKSPYIYMIFFVSIGAIFGIAPNFTFTIILILVWSILQVALLYSLCSKKKKTELTTSSEYLSFLFLISGFAALIYQVAWQRTLFSTFGVNVESVTVIVSLFMFGLGVGSLLGGFLSKIFKEKLITLFIFLEIVIAVFGVFSISIIKQIGFIADTNSVVSLSLYVYVILFLPTLMMGATLPVLVAYVHQKFRNIGKTVGLLYSFNSFGSALASFLTVTVIFVLTGLQESVFVAASFNFLTAFLIFRFSKRVESNDVNHVKIEIKQESAKDESYNIPFVIVLLISMAIGYISLSQEILWFRAFNIASASAPTVFGLVLSSFLFGIAFGSLKAKKICESQSDLCSYIIKALILSSAIYYFGFSLYSFISDIVSYLGLVVGYILVGVVAFYTGSIFPILTHVGINKNSKNVGSSLSLVYFSNIIGATAGPIVTGFIMLDRFSLVDNVRIITFMSLILTIFVMVIFYKKSEFSKKILPIFVATLILPLIAHNILFSNFVEKIHYAKITDEKRPFKYLKENRSGVIAILEDKIDKDIIFGSGIYDGRFNIDPHNDTNIISRAYAIPVLHPNPKRILEVGLSGGAWTKVVSMYEDLESLKAIEINKGYIEITKKYPEIASIFKNPKISVEIDDGRRWLENYNGEKFDFILMNATFYWRSNASNLLSKDFLELAKKHLKKGGVIYYNTTGSSDIVYTAASIFKHVTMFANFVAASDSPFDMNKEEKIANLLKFKDKNGNHILAKKLDNGEIKYSEALNKIASQDLPEYQKESFVNRKNWLITDNNMASEYKTDKHFYQPQKRLLKFLTRD